VIARFCGVRGSTPAPGADFVEVGGHTSCLAITPDGAPGPTVLLDAGTGIRAVTPLLGGEPFRGTILLSHLHWDHVQGLPFFAAGDRDGSEVVLHVPCDGDDDEALALLRRAMSPPHFPIGPEGLQGRWTIAALHPGELLVEGLRVTVAPVAHKGGITYGFRVEDEGGSLAYVPDHLPGVLGPERDHAVALARDVDVLVHDAQFVAGEEAVAADYGHATAEQAVAVAVEAEARRLVLFHHSPARTDEQVAAIGRLAHAAAHGFGLEVTIAREGDAVPSGR
jgi:phosphoribosyl 1,2-cyclic phosphodiesterase